MKKTRDNENKEKLQEALPHTKTRDLSTPNEQDKNKCKKKQAKKKKQSNKRACSWDAKFAVGRDRTETKNRRWNKNNKARRRRKNKLKQE
jgi:hypothetical protein